MRNNHNSLWTQVLFALNTLMAFARSNKGAWIKQAFILFSALSLASTRTFLEDNLQGAITILPFLEEEEEEAVEAEIEEHNPSQSPS